MKIRHALHAIGRVLRRQPKEVRSVEALLARSIEQATGSARQFDRAQRRLCRSQKRTDRASASLKQKLARLTPERETRADITNGLGNAYSVFGKRIDAHRLLMKHEHHLLARFRGVGHTVSDEIQLPSEAGNSFVSLLVLINKNLKKFQNSRDLFFKLLNSFFVILTIILRIFWNRHRRIVSGLWRTRMDDYWQGHESSPVQNYVNCPHGGYL